MGDGSVGRGGVCDRRQFTSPVHSYGSKMADVYDNMNAT